MKLFYGKEEFFLARQKKEIKAKFMCKETVNLDEDAELFLSSKSFFAEKENAILFYPEDIKVLKKLDDKWLDRKNVFAFYLGNVNPGELECESQEFRKLTESQVVSLIHKRLPKLSRQLVDKLLESTGYLDEDGNLFSLMSEISKIALLDDVEINDTLIDAIVGKSCMKYNAFKEADYIMSGDMSKAIDNVMSCPAGQEMMLLGALKRFFRTGWKYNYFEPGIVGYGRKVDSELAVRALQILDSASNDIINGKLPGKISLCNAILKLGEIRNNGDL